MPDVRYWIGDSKDLLRKISDESVHLVVTSPPYWTAKDYGIKNQIGFDQTYEEYVSDLAIIWRECERTLCPNGKICIDVQPLPVSKEATSSERSSIQNIMNDIENSMKRIGMSLSNIFIWDKRKYNNQTIFGSYPYPTNFYSHVAFEFIYVFRKDGETRRVEKEIKEKSKVTMDEWRKWCFDSIWDIPPVIKYGNGRDNPLGHIAPFPLEIPRRLIKLFSFVDDLVLDPFLGCGTVLSACILEKRRGLGIELNPKYETLIRLAIAYPKKVPKYELARILETNASLTDYIKDGCV
jgi:site-specific DNA-methyltransferase (adenine-specific)